MNGLRTYRSFDEIQLVNDYTLRNLTEDPQVDHDLRERIREIFSQLSHSTEFPENQQGDPLIDCKCNNQVAYGIWGAVCLDSFSISLLTNPIWDIHELLAEIEEMDEETLDITPRTEMVRHLSKDLHLASHIDWLKERTKIVIANGNSLWINRKRLFPSLSFCKNTREQIRGLTGPYLGQVIKRLNELEVACKNWTAGAFDCKSALSHCTPESEATLTTYNLEHSFECDDGQTRLFSLHTRFTPGAGRIFFYPHVTDKEQHMSYVGHIGPKLPNVSY